MEKTFSAKEVEVERAWWVVDATNQTLGRLASEIAIRLQGKNKPIYTPHVDCGDFVIVINAEKIRVTGNKMEDKIYYHHSGYPGGLKAIALADQLEKHPRRVMRSAVRGMMPKTKLGRRMRAKLKVYAGPDHPHAAQQPQNLELLAGKTNK